MIRTHLASQRCLLTHQISLTAALGLQICPKHSLTGTPILPCLRKAIKPEEKNNFPSYPPIWLNYEHALVSICILVTFSSEALLIHLLGKGLYWNNGMDYEETSHPAPASIKQKSEEKQKSAFKLGTYHMFLSLHKATIVQ